MKAKLKMALLNQNKFESDEPSENPSKVFDDAGAPSEKTDVAVRQSGALATTANERVIMDGMKDQIPVDYNTFPQINITNGNFVDRESKVVLGDTLVFELLSYQDSYTVSPEDDKAPKEMVRYSDDQVTCSDGTLVKDHLDFLRAAGYPQARVKQRAVVVGCIESTSKPSKFVDEIMQFDLSPASRKHWQRFMANTIILLRKGKRTEEQLRKIKATTQLVSKDSLTWTEALFTPAE